MRLRIPDDDYRDGIDVANTPLRFSLSTRAPAAPAPLHGRDTKTIAAEVGFEAAAAADPDSPAARWGRTTATETAD
jgi:crotonobetainyl-CoA:carnitine CoA-transferase CaiB-like acyl-CoA transferase